MSHTEAQQEIFFETIERMQMAHLVGFTSYDTDYLLRLHRRFPEACIHYEFQGDMDALRTLAAEIPQTQLFAWVRYANDRTAWCRFPAADETICAEIARYANAALWLLDKPEEYKDALRCPCREIAVSFSYRSQLLSLGTGHVQAQLLCGRVARINIGDDLAFVDNQDAVGYVQHLI